MSECFENLIMEHFCLCTFIVTGYSLYVSLHFNIGQTGLLVVLFCC